MYLDRILDHKRRQWAGAGPAGALPPRRRPASPGRFRDALSGDQVALIAEVKLRSPSKGDLWPRAQAVPLARTYAGNGASAVSVLAEEAFFGGSPALVAAVAADAAVNVPVLYKDFVVDVRQVELAHASGADGLLVIVRALDDARLREVTAAARDCGLDPLHECFDEQDLQRALAVGADLVGINNRDLQTFHVDLETGARLRAQVGDGIVTVSESGLTGPAAVGAIAEHGFDACLVGEALLTSGDPPARVAAMSAVPRSPRATARRLNVAILLFEGFDAYDAVGAYEVLSQIPGASVRFLGVEPGAKRSDTAMLALTADFALTDLPDPDVLVIPGGHGVEQMTQDADVLAWLRQAHASSRWAGSAGAGARVMAAAGIATDHTTIAAPRGVELAQTLVARIAPAPASLRSAVRPAGANIVQFAPRRVG